MEQRLGDFEILISKLNLFIKKFYKNLLIRGLIYFVGLVLASILVFDVLEFYFFFNSLVRAILFYSFISLILLGFYIWLYKPSSILLKFSKGLDFKGASLILGKFFPEVSDKLLNTLELQEQSINSTQNDLLVASIVQKTKELKPVPFTEAIDLKENRKYLKYALIPLSIIILLIFTAPSILTESSNRIIKYNTFFEKKAPFTFKILNSSMDANQGQDFLLELEILGDEIPQDIYISEGDLVNKLEKITIQKFQYQFKNILKKVEFNFLANGFASKKYLINVVPRANINRFSVELHFPRYLKKKIEKLSNNGDLNIPDGTEVVWNFNVENTDGIAIYFEGENSIGKKESENNYNLKKKFRKSGKYFIVPHNSLSKKRDSIAYSVNVIPDLFPEIEVLEKRDSNYINKSYFVGTIKDDYGFSDLKFNYKIIKSDEIERMNLKKEVAIPFSKNSIENNFYYYWDLSRLKINPGEVLEYYFEVFDNDGVNGSKSKKSEIKKFNVPSEKEFEKIQTDKSESLKDKLEKTQKDAKAIQEETKKISEKLLSKKELSFEEKKSIQSLLDKQKKLEESIKDIQKQNSTLSQQEEEHKDVEERIAEKKKELENLFNNILDEKTKALIQKLQELLQQNNKANTQEQLEKMKLSSENLEKELDRMLELYKQLEFDQKLDENIKKLDKVQEKQEELLKETQADKQKSEDLKKKQDEINEEFKDLKEDMKALEKLNEELENKNELENPTEDLKNISEDIEKSSEELSNNKSKSSAKSQSSANEKMKSLSQKMKEQQAEMEAEQAEEDIHSLRMTLENLLKVSFDQENIIKQFSKTNINDPKYLTLTQNQNAVKDNMVVIKDSLLALSKRVIEISSFVNKEIADAEFNLNQSIDLLEDRKTYEASRNQQYAMTAINNLALLLSETLEQMQAQANAQKQGQGSKGKKGKKQGSKPGLGALSKLQEKLNQQMKEMQKSIQDGKQQGKGSGEGQGLSEQFAKMAQQQQSIRNALNEINKEENKDGKGSLGRLEQLSKEMEKSERDLYNKLINPETIVRQQEIMTRLLEAEKAEREREEDNKRESKSPEDINYQQNIIFVEFKKLKAKELEFKKTIPPSLNSFYKEKVNQYFQNIKNNQ